MAIRLELELPFEGEEEMLAWNELRGKSLKVLKNGEHLYELLRLGFSAVDIDSMVNLRPNTIENRCMEYILTRPENYDELKYIFEKSIGLPKISKINLFLRSTCLDLREFCDNNGIYFDGLNHFLSVLQETQYMKERLENKAILVRKVNTQRDTGRVVRTKLINTAMPGIIYIA